MPRLPSLYFHCHGYIAQGSIEEIRTSLEECYPRLGQRLPERVEVHLFDTQSQQATFLECEKEKRGITTWGDEAFICSHDAWLGHPRLLVCIERLLALSPIVRLGTIRHEAAHTVLHGAPIYYVFPIPADCIKMAQTKGVSSVVLQQVLYYCAIAVKDFEATKLLLHQGYRECQVAFAEAQFTPSDEDRLAWLLAKDRPQARLLFFTAQLKSLLLAWPLEVAGLFHLEQSTEAMLGYLEPEQRKQLLDMATNIASQLGENTHDNARSALRQSLQMLL